MRKKYNKQGYYEDLAAEIIIYFKKEYCVESFITSKIAKHLDVSKYQILKSMRILEKEGKVESKVTAGGVDWYHEGHELWSMDRYPPRREWYPKRKSFEW